MEKTIFYGICALSAVIMLIYYATRKNRLSSLVKGCILGLAALFILERFGEKYGINMPLNIMNVSGSALLGVPYLICVVLLKIL